MEINHPVSGEAAPFVVCVPGVQLDWAELSDFLPSDYQGPLRRSAIASSFLAALELARQGRIDLKQEAAFEPLYLKAAKA